MRRCLFITLLVIAGCGERPPRLIFIGLDGADWQLLDKYMADGTMPELAKLVARGERRVLMTQHPPLSPLVWTTMMTGVSPLEHRILDFARFNPVTHAKEPITSDERAVPAIWNMATYGGKRVDVFGLWATYPPEQVHGTIVSDREIASGESDPLRRTETETETIHRVSLERIRKDKPDLAIVYFEGTDAIGHLLVNGDREVVRRYFASIDRMLGEYASLDTDLMIASDHGFDWFGSHKESPTAVGTAAKWHRDEGIYLYVPRGSTRGSRAPNARVDQICSTILAILGLPPGESLAPGLIANNRPAVDYRRKFHRATPGTDTRGSNEEIAKLRSLGYIGDSKPNVASTRTAASFDNEALILRQRGRLDDAEKAFEAALAVDPKSPSVLWNYGDLMIHRAAASKDPIGLLTHAMQFRPELVLHRGRYKLQANDCRGALRDFQSAPDDAMKYAMIGTAETCLGNRTAAAVAFERSRKLDPNLLGERASRPQ